ncbi:PilW family protein [Halomonas saccharevitans]|uniref:PilW family protein n=1 Tax=Halomonas saccharevitans TaxID=416872 RepID=UPI001C318D2F|nr:type II secretion system protein [Halomonas saccharevitans]
MKQSGFSLVELMVALLIGLVIILGAGQLFLTGFQNFQKIEELSDKQATLMFAADVLVREARRGEDVKHNYEVKVSQDGESCSLYDKDSNEPIVDGLSIEDGCDNNFNVEKDCDGVTGLFCITFTLAGEASPIGFHAMDRTQAVQ